METNHHSKQFRLPGIRKIGSLGTAVFMAAALIPFAGFMLSSDGPFLYVLSGRLFSDNFYRLHVGTALDQPTIGKWLFLFTLFTTAVLPYLAAVRWISNRSTPAGRWAFGIPALFLCVLLLIVLTMPFYWLIQYIHAMGFTPNRITALTYALSGYLIVVGFLIWSLRIPRKTNAQSYVPRDAW